MAPGHPPTPVRPATPVRAAAPTAALAPSERGPRVRRLRPPPGTLAVTGILAAAALGGFGYVAVTGLLPHGTRPLRAPVSDALQAACTVHPAICRGRVRVRFRP